MKKKPAYVGFRMENSFLDGESQFVIEVCLPAPQRPEPQIKNSFRSALFLVPKHHELPLALFTRHCEQGYNLLFTSVLFQALGIAPCAVNLVLGGCSSQDFASSGVTTTEGRAPYHEQNALHSSRTRVGSDRVTSSSFEVSLHNSCPRAN